MVTGGPLVRVRDLVVEFPPDEGPRILDRVAVDIKDGEVVALVGESGSGKTTLARALVGSTPRGAEATGSITIAGVDVLRASRRQLRALRARALGFVFQDPLSALNPLRTCGSQIADALRLSGLGRGRSEINEAVHRLLREVRFDDPERVAAAYPHELSGGMRQRVVIAAAIACQPRLLIADEATSGLDVTVQQRILDLLADLQQQRHMSVLLITHDLALAHGTAQSVIVLYGGRVVENGPASAVLSHPAHPYTEALLETHPDRMAEPGEEITPIPGTPPAPTPGQRQQCVFADRCRYVADECRSGAPALVEVGRQHEAACLFPLGDGKRSS